MTDYRRTITGETLSQIVVGEFRRQPARSWKTSADDSAMSCYLDMEGRVTIAQVIAHFEEHFPHVDPMGVALNYATATWEEPATPEDVARREEYRAKQVERQEQWERGMYEKLKVKFES